ncbi:MAG: Glu/Leu/Phe/Val family dehydrogenase [bacterium]
MDIERNPTTSQLNFPHMIIEVSDETLGKLGYVVIDRAVQGTASGGVRFAPDISPDELASLARSMTYKWAFLNVSMGGAKAGILADPHEIGCDRPTLMEAFGRSIAPLVRRQIYHPGIDMGTTLDDLCAIMRGAGQPLVGRQIDGSFCTGLTVFETIRQVTKSDGIGLDGLRVAIEGFGKVASTVAELLAQAGAKLTAVSTIEGALIAESGLDVAQLLSLKQQHGDRLVHRYTRLQPVQPSALFVQPVDLLVPGARPHVIHSGNADQIQARWIVPISNAPVTPRAEQILVARGAIVIPDFAANCGGVLASSMLSNGFAVEDVQQVVETTFATVITRLLERAHRQRLPAGEIARALAWQNHLALNEPVDTTSNKLARVSRVLKNQRLSGIWYRLAWQLHRRWPRLNGAIRPAALEQYTAQGLGITLQRVTVVSLKSRD